MLHDLIPTAWSELSGAAAAYVARLYARGLDTERTKVYLALRLLGVRRVRPCARGYELHIGTGRIVIRPEQLSAAMDALAFLDRAPDFPVRPDRLRRAEALAADLRGVPFGTYLRITTLARAYVEQDHRADIGTRLVTVLYPELDESHVRPWHHLVAYQWVAGLTAWLASKYRDLFPPALTGDEGQAEEVASAEEQVNALIRSLTGGDILREQAVLDSDTHRALTELNAKAREAAEMRKAASQPVGA